MKKLIRTLAALLSLSLVLAGCKSKNGGNESSYEPIVSSVTSDASSSSSEDVSVFDVYDGYYDDIHWTNGEDLRAKLYTAMRKNYTPIAYSGNPTNWETNQYADQALDDFECVDVVYSSTNDLKIATNSNGSGWQREHAFPACLMTGSLTGTAVKNLGRATDFHNLFASNYSGNTSRGSKNYGNADTKSDTYVSKLTDTNDGYSYDEMNFEPGNKDKGRLARAIFYMATMYMYDEEDTVNNVTMKGLNIQEDYVTFSSSAGYDAFAIGNLSDLLSWNSYPVDRLEYQHSESVRTHLFNGKAQGNRNAFVDFPELVDYVYGSKKNQPGKLSDLTPTCNVLKTTSHEFSNYAIESAKRNYFVGDSTSDSDWKIVNVYTDYSTSQADFQLEYVPYTFTSSDVGTKITNAPTPNGNIPFAVKVEEASIESCSWKYTFENKNAFGTSGTKIEKAGTSVTLNNLDWTFSYESSDDTDGNIPVSNSSNYGGCISIGSGSSNNWADTLIIQSNEALSAVDSVFIKGNTASGKTYNMSVYVGDEKVLENMPLKRDASQCSIIGGTFEALDGVVKIVMTNVSASLYLQQMGVNYTA